MPLIEQNHVDALAANFGLSRIYGESDDDLRNRIALYMRDVSSRWEGVMASTHISGMEVVDRDLRMKRKFNATKSLNRFEILKRDD